MYTFDVFDSDGTLAIMRENGQDLLHLRRVDKETAGDEFAGPGWVAMSDEEHQAIIDRIVAAFKAVERLKADLAYHQAEAERITRESLDIDTADEGAYSVEDDTAESYHTGRVEALDNVLHMLAGDEVVLYSETEAGA